MTTIFHSVYLVYTIALAFNNSVSYDVYVIYLISRKANNMTKYIIQDREAGNFIDKFENIEAAEQALEEFEKTDKKEGNYVPDFYEIVEAE